jgi:hypothetical protein
MGMGMQQPMGMGMPHNDAAAMQTMYDNAMIGMGYAVPLMDNTATSYGVVMPGANTGYAHQPSQPKVHPGDKPGRSIYLGNILADNFTKEDVQQAVAHFGAIESVKLLPEKKTAFVNFYDASSAAAAKADGQIQVLGGAVRVGWAKSPEDRAATNYAGNSSMGNVASNDMPMVTNGMMGNGMMGNGMAGMGNGMTQMNSVPGMVNTGGMGDMYAMAAQGGMSSMGMGMGMGTGMGMGMGAPMAMVQPAMGVYPGSGTGGPSPAGFQGGKKPLPKAGSRSLYLGNYAGEPTEADVTAAVQHFGPIESVRLLGQKKTAFVNFVDAESAAKAMAAAQSILILGNPVRVGWAKPR